MYKITVYCLGFKLFQMKLLSFNSNVKVASKRGNRTTRRVGLFSLIEGLISHKLSRLDYQLNARDRAL